MLPIIDGILKIADKLIPDPNKRYEFQIELQKLADQAEAREHDEMMGQINVNLEEAKSGSLWVAGWRPFIGWTGGVGLAYSFVLEPIMSWTARVGFKYVGDFPALDTSSLMVLVTGMLGFGGLRTYEKYKGVSHEGSLAPIVTPISLPAKPKKKILGGLWPF